METNSGTNSDSKTYGYIVLHRTFHIAQTRTWIPTPESLLECVSNYPKVQMSNLSALKAYITIN